MKACPVCAAPNPPDATACDKCYATFGKPEAEALKVPKVSIVDVSMPFGSMVVFMLKWAFASIPALMMLAVVGGFVFAVLDVLIRTHY